MPPRIDPPDPGDIIFAVLELKKAMHDREATWDRSAIEADFVEALGEDEERTDTLKRISKAVALPSAASTVAF